MSMRTLLGMGRLVMRMVLLKPRDNTDESERAIVGNTILLAQPTPKMIASKLPPTEAEQAAYFNAIYGCEASKMNEKKALQVNRAEYLECARLRAQRCPLFASVEVDEERAQSELPQDGLPNGIFHGAIEMATLEQFAPSLSGPATRELPFRRQVDEVEADGGEAGEAETSEDGPVEQGGVPEHAHGAAAAPDALIAEENANAEFLIGLDGSPDDDAVGRLASFQAKVALAEEAAKRMSAAAKNLQRATRHCRRRSTCGQCDGLGCGPPRIPGQTPACVRRSAKPRAEHGRRLPR